MSSLLKVRINRPVDFVNSHTVNESISIKVIRIVALKMKFLIHIALTALVLHSTQACRDGNCNAFCAGEIKDPTKKLTFYSEGALAVFNRKFEGDESNFENIR